MCSSPWCEARDMAATADEGFTIWGSMEAGSVYAEPQKL